MKIEIFEDGKLIVSIDTRPMKLINHKVDVSDIFAKKIEQTKLDLAQSTQVFLDGEPINDSDTVVSARIPKCVRLDPTHDHEECRRKWRAAEIKKGRTKGNKIGRPRKIKDPIVDIPQEIAKQVEDQQTGPAASKPADGPVDYTCADCIIDYSIPSRKASPICPKCGTGAASFEKKVEWS